MTFLFDSLEYTSLPVRQTVYEVRTSTVQYQYEYEECGIEMSFAPCSFDVTCHMSLTATHCDDDSSSSLLPTRFRALLDLDTLTVCTILVLKGTDWRLLACRHIPQVNICE
jgi:hypothetical protein